MTDKRIKDLTNTAAESDIASGNYFVLDGSAGTKKLNSTTLLELTAQNALAGNIAPEFDQEKTPGEDGFSYHTLDPIVHEGRYYIFIQNHVGAWDSSDVSPISASAFAEYILNNDNILLASSELGSYKFIDSNGSWLNDDAQHGGFIRAKNFNKLLVQNLSSYGNVYIGLLKSFSESSPVFCDGESRRSIPKDESLEIALPEDCEFVWVSTFVDNAPFSVYKSLIVLERRISDTVKNISDAVNSVLQDVSDKFIHCSGVQSYGNDGDAVSFERNLKYEYTYVEREKVENLFARIVTPGSPSSQVQFVDGEGLITRRKVVSPTQGSDYVYKLEFEGDEVGVYISTSCGMSAIYDTRHSVNFSESVKSVVSLKHEIDSGVDDLVTEMKFIGSDGKWADSIEYIGVFLDVSEWDKNIVVSSKGRYTAKYAFLTDKSFVRGGTPSYVTGYAQRYQVPLDETISVTIPDGTRYMWFSVTNRDFSNYYRFAVRFNKYLFLRDEFNIQDKGRLLKLNSFGNLKDELPVCWRYGDYVDVSGMPDFPIGDSALGYNDFIESTWDTLLESYPDEVTKSVVCKDSSDTFDIYKYVFTPAHYKRTVFLTAGAHGDEYAGFWGLFRMIKNIYDNGFTDPKLRELRHNVRFVIIPVLGPYGVEHRQRLNSQGLDTNLNFEVNRFVFPRADGSKPFMANEALAVKIVADQYNAKFDLFCDLHTDPYDGYRMGNYTEVTDGSLAYSICYNVTLDERAKLKARYGFNPAWRENFVVWGTPSCSSFRYMDLVRGVPAAIIEVGTGIPYAQNGSGALMDIAVSWYTNVISSLIANL